MTPNSLFLESSITWFLQKKLIDVQNSYFSFMGITPCVYPSPQGMGRDSYFLLSNKML